MNKHDQSWKDFLLRQHKEVHYSAPESASKVADAIMAFIGVAGFAVVVLGLLLGWWD